MSSNRDLKIKKKAWDKYKNTINLAWGKYMKAVNELNDEKGWREYKKVTNKARREYKKEIREEGKNLVKV